MVAAPTESCMQACFDTCYLCTPSNSIVPNMCYHNETECILWYNNYLIRKYTHSIVYVHAWLGISQ